MKTIINTLISAYNLNDVISIDEHYTTQDNSQLVLLISDDTKAYNNCALKISDRVNNFIHALYELCIDEGDTLPNEVLYDLSYLYHCDTEDVGIYANHHDFLGYTSLAYEYDANTIIDIYIISCQALYDYYDDVQRASSEWQEVYDNDRHFAQSFDYWRNGLI